MFADLMDKEIQPKAIDVRHLVDGAQVFNPVVVAVNHSDGSAVFQIGNLGNAVVVAFEPGEAGASLHIQRQQLVVIAVEFLQLGLALQIERLEVISLAVKFLQCVQCRQVERGQLVVGTVEKCQLGKRRNVEGGKRAIIHDKHREPRAIGQAGDARQVVIEVAPQLLHRRAARQVKRGEGVAGTVHSGQRWVIPGDE